MKYPYIPALLRFFACPEHCRRASSLLRRNDKSLSSYTKISNKRLPTVARSAKVGRNEPTKKRIRLHDYTITRLSLATVCLWIWIPQAQAAYPDLTYRHGHHLFVIDPDEHPLWLSAQEVWTYNGVPFSPPASLRIDGDDVPDLPPGVIRSMEKRWDHGAIRSTIAQEIALSFDRDPRSVMIRKADDVISFEGIGLPGRNVDLDRAASLTIEALQSSVHDIVLPVIETQPEITVKDKELAELGITEVVTVGESDYRGSPYNRRHNIATGLNRFNGHLVLPGETFSFNAVLGPVNATTGYKKELIIFGDKTLPDYGGGLCQVSTTTYRGVWEYGFPIGQRINHSYSVRYYFPQGTDATIYPPYKDVQFLNDSAHALLLQTHIEDGRAYVIYYGTKDDRESQLLGPFVWGQTQPPPDKVEYTTELAPGETKKVGERVPGIKAAWFRITKKPDEEEEIIESYYSNYEARPRYTQIGVAATPAAVPTHDLTGTVEERRRARQSQSSASTRRRIQFFRSPRRR